MKKSKFSEAQIVATLKEGATGMPIVELLRKHGISRPTFYLWRQKYGGAGVPELQKVKALEAKNARLKHMYAELAPQHAAVQDVLSRSL